jgi:hypothetical protein
MFSDWNIRNIVVPSFCRTTSYEGLNVTLDHPMGFFLSAPLDAKQLMLLEQLGNKDEYPSIHACNYCTPSDKLLSSLA